MTDIIVWPTWNVFHICSSKLVLSHQNSGIFRTAMNYIVFFNNVFKPGSTREFGLGFYPSPYAGHMVFLKAWKNENGILNYRQIDFQAHPEHVGRFVENRLPGGSSVLIHFDPNESTNHIIRENRRFGQYNDPKGTWIDLKDLMKRTAFQVILNSKYRHCYGFDETEDMKCHSGCSKDVCDNAMCTCILNDTIKISDRFVDNPEIGNHERGSYFFDGCSEHAGSCSKI